LSTPPPNLETIVNFLHRARAIVSPARAQLQFYNCKITITIFKCNLQAQFTSAIYKLRSTTGQMPALVFSRSSVTGPDWPHVDLRKPTTASIPAPYLWRGHEGGDSKHVLFIQKVGPMLFMGSWCLLLDILYLNSLDI
jgi:hypothetical protein